MRITISEIARMASVSKTTVSRVINNKADVQSETRKKINELISQYDFHPNAFARAISNQKSHTIGLVIAQSSNFILSNPYYYEIIRGVSNVSKKLGYHLLLTYCEGEEYLEAAQQKRLDGVILISPGRGQEAIIQQLEKLEIPFVSISRMPGRADIHYICTDDFDGASKVVAHLARLGHNKIAYINGPKSMASSNDRLDGYRFELNRNKIPYRPEFIVEGDTSINSGHTCMQKLLKLEGITAVFVASDLMAIGAIQAIEEAGKHVPDDYSIVGFDDIPLAGFLNPPLTTIHQDAFEKGEMSTRMLLDILNKEPVSNCVKMPVKLITRQSTKAI